MHVDPGGRQAAILRGKFFELRVSNRTIWMLWFQGFADAPPLVQACLELWRRFNPTWRWSRRNRTSLSEWVDLEQAIDPERGDLDMRKVPERLARLCLLAPSTAVLWADADLVLPAPARRSAGRGCS